jgi:hypothetical protein
MFKMARSIHPKVYIEYHRDGWMLAGCVESQPSAICWRFGLDFKSLI